MYFKSPILVTGSHRSGTTWVAKVLAASASVHYVPEQFNLNLPQCSCGHKFNQWFQYISSDNETQFYNHMKHALGLSYRFVPDLRAAKNPKYAFKILTTSSKFILHRLLNIRPLLKDPIAFFSANWLANRFNMDVIVLIRHPAAFASSLKRLNWKFDFSHFTEQPLLMQDLLEPFSKEIKEYTLKEYDIIDQAILLWNIFHYVILKYKKNHKRWIFLRHEDISRNPFGQYKFLYKQLGLRFTSKTTNLIDKYSYSKQSLPDLNNQEIHILSRNSESNIYSWKDRLNSNEISRIRNGVKPICSSFYSDAEW
jgi:hypothetical protein